MRNKNVWIMLLAYALFWALLISLSTTEGDLESQQTDPVTLEQELVLLMERVDMLEIQVGAQQVEFQILSAMQAVTIAQLCYDQSVTRYYLLGETIDHRECIRQLADAATQIYLESQADPSSVK